MASRAADRSALRHRGRRRPGRGRRGQADRQCARPLHRSGRRRSRRGHLPARRTAPHRRDPPAPRRDVGRCRHVHPDLPPRARWHAHRRAEPVRRRRRHLRRAGRRGALRRSRQPGRDHRERERCVAARSRGRRPLPGPLVRPGPDRCPGLCRGHRAGRPELRGGGGRHRPGAQRPRGCQPHDHLLTRRPAGSPRHRPGGDDRRGAPGARYQRRRDDGGGALAPGRGGRVPGHQPDRERRDPPGRRLPGHGPVDRRGGVRGCRRGCGRPAGGAPRALVGGGAHLAACPRLPRGGRGLRSRRQGRRRRGCRRGRGRGRGHPRLALVPTRDPPGPRAIALVWSSTSRCCSWAGRSPWRCSSQLRRSARSGVLGALLLRRRRPDGGWRTPSPPPERASPS